jgi:biotin carboxyl carrier protein
LSLAKSERRIAKSEKLATDHRQPTMTYDVIVDGKTHRLELTRGEKTWLCKIDGHEIEVDAALTARDVLSLIIGGDAFEVKRERSLAGDVHLVIGSARHAIDVQDPRSLRTRRAASGDEAGPQKITAPMPGKIVRVMVAEKDEVKAGQGVVVMEAMKMQNEMKSPKDGKVQKILVAEGATVNAGDPLAVIE